jgi:uncharacterized protein (DUF2384 family)
MQLKHPSAEAIRSRALEVFGNPNKARTWMSRPRRIFDGKSPDQVIASGDINLMREVLKALIAIEFGTFS